MGLCQDVLQSHGGFIWRAIIGGSFIKMFPRLLAVGIRAGQLRGRGGNKLLPVRVTEDCRYSGSIYFNLSSVHLRSLPGSEFNLLWSSFSLFCRISSVPFALSKVALYLASSEFVASNSALSASSLCLSWSRRQRPFRFCCNSLLRGMSIQFERHLHLCGLLISPSVVRTLPYRNRQNPLCRDAACRADQSSTDFHGRQCSHSGFLRQWPDYP